MQNKLFADRLNKELDAIGVPTREDERIEALAKLVRIPRFKAGLWVNGSALPDEEHLQQLAEELEVSSAWLIGKSEQRQKK